MLHETHINSHQREHCYYYYIKSTKGTSTRRYHPALLVVFSVPLGVKNQVFDAVHWSCYMWWIRTLCCLFVRTAVPSSLLISRTSWSNRATSLATTLRKCHRHWQVLPTVVIYKCHLHWQVHTTVVIWPTSWSNSATSLATTLRKCRGHWQVHPTVVISWTSWSNRATSLATMLCKCHCHWQVHTTVVIWLMSWSNRATSLATMLCKWQVHTTVVTWHSV